VSWWKQGQEGKESCSSQQVEEGNDDDIATGDALHFGHSVWHVLGELARDSGSMSSGTSLL
jgi:hypothetical protein